MPLVLDKARELAEAISESEELARLRQSAENINTDEAASAALKQFQEKQALVERASRSGIQLSPEQLSELEQMQAQIQVIPVIKEFGEAQSCFNDLIQQVNGIIATAVLGVAQDES